MNKVYLLLNEPFNESEVICFIFSRLLFIIHLCQRKATKLNVTLEAFNRRKTAFCLLIYFKWWWTQIFLFPLTERWEIRSHEVASFWHDGLQTHTRQTWGQLVPLVMQHRGKLLEVALRRTEQLILSLKALSHCFLLKAGAGGTNEGEIHTGHDLKWQGVA